MDGSAAHQLHLDRSDLLGCIELNTNPLKLVLVRGGPKSVGGAINGLLRLYTPSMKILEIDLFLNTLFSDSLRSPLKLEAIALLGATLSPEPSCTHQPSSAQKSMQCTATDRASIELELLDLPPLPGSVRDTAHTPVLAS